MGLVIKPGLMKFMLHLQSTLGYPRDWIGKKLGLIMPQSGWDYIKTRTVKNFELGIEVRRNLSRFGSASEIESLVKEAIQLAAQHYGDMVLDADVKVVKGQLPGEKDLRIGHQVELGQDRDFTKFIQVSIILDEAQDSYIISALVYRHIIDGIPMLLLLYLIHNHLILKQDSFISGCARVPAFNLQDKFDKFNVSVDEERWKEVLPENDDADFVSVGAHINVRDSNIYKLRRKIAKEVGSYVSGSSVELALLAIEMGMNYASDCVAQGPLKRNGKLDLQQGYFGLGQAHTQGYANIGTLEKAQQYRWLCDKMAESTREILLEREGRGRASKMLQKVSRISDKHRLAGDKIASYDSVMVVANCQILGSNFNGIDYGVPIFVEDITPEHLGLIGIPATPEFAPEVVEARAAKGLKSTITEVSFASGEKYRKCDSVYKVMKISLDATKRILSRWGYDSNELEKMSKTELGTLVFRETFRPDSPLEGRAEKLAGGFLEG